jgi:DNA-binding IclR family transcriptional regulator
VKGVLRGRGKRCPCAFTPGRSLLTLSEISRRAGLSPTTAHRLAGELVGWGALERDDDGRYRLLELAARAGTA